MKTWKREITIRQTIWKFSLNYERGSNAHDLGIELSHYIPARSWTFSVSLWWVSLYVYTERAGINREQVENQEMDRLFARIVRNEGEW